MTGGKVIILGETAKTSQPVCPAASLMCSTSMNACAIKS